MTIVLAQVANASSKDKVFLYDTGMLVESKHFVLPELKVDFEKLNENFKIGDTLKVRLVGKKKNERELSWITDAVLKGSARGYFREVIRKKNECTD